MKRKMLSVFLCGSMILTGMIGVSSMAAESDELVEIVWQWPSLGNPSSGLQEVEDALNAMMEPDIGVHVILEPINYSDRVNETVLAVSSGEQVDLCLTVGTGVGGLVSNGLLEPLDDIVEEHAPELLEICGEDSVKGGYYAGELYGLPDAYMRGDAYGYLMRSDMIEKYGFEIDDEKLYTLDEIEEMFAVVKEGEGSNFFCVIPSTGQDPLSRSAFEYDKLGSTTASGVLMLNKDFNNMTISNLYETEEYEEYAKRMYDWAQKGYISKDAATNTEDRDIQLMGGNYLGYFSWSTPDNVNVVESTTKMDMTVLHVIDALSTADLYGNILWSVPITSVNPEKAVETLNYIYAHTEAARLLQYGIEGRDYEIVEETEEGTKVKFLAEDPSTLPYYMPFGVYGDRLAKPVIDPNPINMNEILREFGNSIPDSRKSVAIGYRFNRESVATEYSTVTSVLSQYVPSVNCGTAEPEENLKNFRQALKDAGIDKVIEENQRQFDQWAAANNK